MAISSPQEVLEYWFSLANPGKKDDARIKENLGALYEQAASGALDDWVWDPRCRLSLVILLDQIPRHLYRKDARAYATDRRAQHIACYFVQNENEWDGLGNPREKLYALMPYLHAEDINLQHLVNPMLHDLSKTQPELAFVTHIADLYLKTIERFGHFPHRNDMRGIPSTAEEMQFLKEEWHQKREKILQAGNSPK